MNDSRRGLLHGISAYVLWGVVPVYWKLLTGVSAIEVIAHRVVWGAVVFAAIAWQAGVLPEVRAALADRKTVIVMALSGVLLVVNWAVFVGAVLTGHLVDASLGYFINPLASVALGTLVLRERLRRLQWLALGLALAGVVILTVRAGHVPWISLVLAATFGTYGLVRKMVRLSSLVGSTVETGLVAPLAVLYLAIAAAGGGGQLGHASLFTHLVLCSTGLITAVPLLLFTSAARRLPLSTLGFVQYLGAIGQLVLAVALYHETFAGDQMIAFGLVALALVAFSTDLVRQTQPNRPVM